jgi:hypothetical protein
MSWGAVSESTWYVGLVECWVGAVGGTRIGRGNRSSRRKSAPVPLCPPQIPRDLTWDRARAAAMGNQRLTASAIACPNVVITNIISDKRRHAVSLKEIRTLFRLYILLLLTAIGLMPDSNVYKDHTFNKECGPLLKCVCSNLNSLTLRQKYLLVQELRWVAVCLFHFYVHTILSYSHVFSFYSSHVATRF